MKIFWNNFFLESIHFKNDTSQNIRGSSILINLCRYLWKHCDFDCWRSIFFLKYFSTFLLPLHLPSPLISLFLLNDSILNLLVGTEEGRHQHQQTRESSVLGWVAKPREWGRTICEGCPSRISWAWSCKSAAWCEVSGPEACGKVVHVRKSHYKCAKGGIHKKEQPKCIHSGGQGQPPDLGSQNHNRIKSIILRKGSPGGVLCETGW